MQYDFTDIETDVEAWAAKEPHRALELGKRLMLVKGPADLVGLSSLGDFEDRASAWAAENPFKARMLFLKLMPSVLAATRTAP